MIFAAQDLESIAARTFLCMAIILLVGRVFGRLFSRLGQPSVLGEIVAGICLGPSLLGKGLVNDLFPVEVRPFLRVIAEVGLVVFMFVVGLEVDLASIRRSGRAAAAISFTSILFPFVLGASVLGTLLYDDHKIVEGEPVKHVTFALFIGVSMCATAFPILARILAERRMFRIPLGTLLIACAAIDDVAAFSLLAVVLAIAASSGVAEVPLQIGGLIVFVLALAFVIRPLLARFFVPRYHAAGRMTPDLLAVLFIGLLVAVWTTHEMGLATLLGAFLFGAAMPRENTSAMFHEVVERVEGISVTMLLPVFFVVTGIGVNLRGLEAKDIGPALLILAIACIGKFIGASVAAKACGISNRQSMAVGVMMNTRGLAELVILQIGRDAGVLDQKMFTMLVLMAVLTTLMAGPVLKLVYPDRWLERDIAEADRAALGDTKDRVLVAVADAEATARTVSLARMMTPAARGEVLLTHLPLASATPELGGGLLADLGAVAEAMRSLDAARLDLASAGLGVIITSRPSVDPAGEILHQAEVGATRIILLDENLPEQVITAILVDPPCDVATVDGPNVDGREGAIVVEIDGTADSELAIELAARIALASSRSIELVESPQSRRNAAERASSALAELGLTATVARADIRTIITGASAALVLLPRSRRTGSSVGSAAPVMFVAAIDRDRPPLAQRLAGVAALQVPNER